MKTSVTTAATAATPVADSVTGAVGSVTGAVGSVTAAVSANVTKVNGHAILGLWHYARSVHAVTHDASRFSCRSTHHSRSE